MITSHGFNQWVRPRGSVCLFSPLGLAWAATISVPHWLENKPLTAQMLTNAGAFGSGGRTPQPLTRYWPRDVLCSRASQHHY